MTALVFFSNFDEPEPWEAALKAQMPELDFRLGGDPSGVTVALVWAPPAGFFAPYKDLKLVVNLGAGVDSLVRRDDLPPLPISRLNDAGMVQLMSSYVTHAVTHYARDFHLMERNRLKKVWEYIHPRALASHRVSVMGLGELGGAAAAALAGMGYEVTGWARSAKSIPGVRCLSGEAGFATALREADTVVLMLPLTPQTTGVIDARAFAAMKPGVNLINVGRAGLLDEEALIAALNSGQVAEATLDVFRQEPLPYDHAFWEMERVRITPHIASITVPESAAVDVAESIRRVLRGEPPLHQVDAKRGY